MQVNILDAKKQLSRLIKRAQAGEEIVIVNRGQPVTRLVAARPPADAGAVQADGIVGWLATPSLPAHARRSAAEIDAAISQERSAWD